MKTIVTSSTTTPGSKHQTLTLTWAAPAIGSLPLSYQPRFRVAGAATWGCKPEPQKIPSRIMRARTFPTKGLFRKVCGHNQRQSRTLISPDAAHQASFSGKSIPGVSAAGPPAQDPSGPPRNWGLECVPGIFAPVPGAGVGRGVDFEVGGSRGRGSLRGHHGDQQA